MMVHLQKHAEEIFWLQRRIELLYSLDDLLNEDEPIVQAHSLTTQYSRVENPTDLVKRLKEIYGEDLE